MQTLQISSTVITGWATVGQYLEGEGSQSGNYCINRKWVSSWLLCKRAVYAQTCKYGKTGTGEFSRCNTIQTGCLSGLTESTPPGTAWERGAQPHQHPAARSSLVCVVPAWKWEEALASPRDPQPLFFEPGLGRRCPVLLLKEIFISSKFFLGLLNLHLPFLQQTWSKAVPKSCFTFPAEAGKKYYS